MDARKNVKKIFIVPITVIAAIAALIALIVLFELGIMGVNNVIAHNTLSELMKIPLPEKTDVVDTVYVAGKLLGNGNGMQYFGAALLKSDLTIEELERYYDIPNQQFVEKYGDEEYSVVKYFQFDKEISGGNYYVVYRLGSTNSELLYMWDLRGH